MNLDYVRPSRAAGVIIAGLLVIGCKDDTIPVEQTEGGSSTTGDGDTTTSGTSTGAESQDTTAGDQGGSSGESSTGAPPLPTEVDVRGTIQDFFLMAAIPNADISLESDPSLSTMSTIDGEWTFLGLPANTFDRFIVADTDEYWGAVVPFQTQYEDIEEAELSQVSLEVIDIQIGVLQEQDPMVMVEDDTAVLLIALEQNLATGAIVEIDPPPPEGTYYAPDANGQPILNTNEIQWSVYPVAVVFNLPPGPEGTYEITVTHPERDCTPEDPSPPTFGRHINLIRVDCPPAE